MEEKSEATMARYTIAFNVNLCNYYYPADDIEAHLSSSFVQMSTDG